MTGRADRGSVANVGPWLVHALTASGAVLAFVALLAVEQGAWRAAFAWLALALVVDGIDGPLARRLDVTGRLPWIDGATLDLVVDFLTYVFVPAVLICRAGLIPAWFTLPAAALILTSSLFHYARTDLKTDDNYFRGFPALWNIVAFGLFVAQPGAMWGAATIVFAALLTFAPVHFVHPVRVQAHRPWLVLLSALWTVSTIVLLWPGPAGLMTTRAALLVWLGSAAGLVGFGFLRTAVGPVSQAGGGRA